MLYELYNSAAKWRGGKKKKKINKKEAFLLDPPFIYVFIMRSQRDPDRGRRPCDFSLFLFYDSSQLLIDDCRRSFSYTITYYEYKRVHIITCVFVCDGDTGENYM